MLRPFCLFLLFVTGNLHAQIDSATVIKDTTEKTYSRGLSFLFFPTIETGLLLKRSVGKSTFSAGGFFAHFNRPDSLCQTIQLPDRLTDSSIIYSNRTDKQQRFNFRIGWEYPVFVKFCNSIKTYGRSPRLVIKTGAELACGKHSYFTDYAEGYIKYMFDSTGTFYYLDENNQPVNDPLDAKGYVTVSASSSWNYSTWEILPWFSFFLSSQRLPFSAGFRMGWRLAWYDMKQKTVDDPKGIIEEKPGSFFTHGGNGYIVLNFHLR